MKNVLKKSTKKGVYSQNWAMVSTLNLNLLPKALSLSRTEQIMQKCQFSKTCPIIQMSQKLQILHTVNLFLYVGSIVRILNFLIFFILEKQFFLDLVNINIFKMWKNCSFSRSIRARNLLNSFKSKSLSLLVPWQCSKKNTLDQWMTDSLTS